MEDEIKRSAELLRYALKVARIKPSPEEEKILREASKSGGFSAFKRAVDLMEAYREKGVSARALG